MTPAEKERAAARKKYIAMAQLRPDGTPSDMHAALRWYWDRLAEIKDKYGS